MKRFTLFGVALLLAGLPSAGAAQDAVARIVGPGRPRRVKVCRLG